MKLNGRTNEMKKCELTNLNRNDVNVYEYTFLNGISFSKVLEFRGYVYFPLRGRFCSRMSSE